MFFCVFLPVAWVPSKGLLGVWSWRAMTLTVYSVPGRRPLSTTLSWSPLGAGRSSLSPSSELEYRTRYDVTVPSGLSQVMRMEVESMSEKLRSLGWSIAAGIEENGRERCSLAVKINFPRSHIPITKPTLTWCEETTKKLKLWLKDACILAWSLPWT